MTVDTSSPGTEDIASSGRAAERFRLVVFTRGPLTAVNRVFYERLSRDPALELSAIIVDDHARPRGAVPSIFQILRRHGLAGLTFKLWSKVGEALRRAAIWVFERTHGLSPREESYTSLEHTTGVRVHRVPDIHAAATLSFVRSLRPQLGIILGGRILRDSLVRIPEHGTLNIHKAKVPEYRGGGPVGYWEILAGESSIGVTIHRATAKVDAGPVLACATIPIEACDTLESLQIKADLLGARLYHETIRNFALGKRRAAEQDLARGATYRTPSPLNVWRVERTLRRRVAAGMPFAREHQGWQAKARMLARYAQYVVLLPALLGMRRWLIGRHRAPVCILVYHIVANRPLNHMCLPLEEFVRQVEFLRRYYDLVSLPGAIERIRRGASDRIAASITFDDGYRENAWAIEYLRYFEIPACFFVSIGHVRDGTAFAHDRRRGFEAAQPMSEAEVRELAANGFVIGSHGLHHEDFGQLDSEAADRVLRESRDLIERVCGQAPEHFSFPIGQRGTNITQESFKLAMHHYPFVYSAYGGYCFPHVGRRHLLRVVNPHSIPGLAMIMNGYTGFGSVTGNVWGLRTDGLAPYWKGSHPPRAAVWRQRA